MLRIHAIATGCMTIPGATSLTCITDGTCDGCQVLVTDRSGPPAISEAFETCRVALDDWILIIDPNVILPADWLVQLEREGLDQRNVYGAKRQGQDDTEIGSWFTLFHGKDPRAAVRREGYDEGFVGRWPVDRQFWLDMPVGWKEVGK